jgi:CheY-like chemotaxis protein
MIDDSELVRALAQVAFRATGWNVAYAQDGETGLALAAADPPDAILLDLMMPGVDGPEVLRRLRADPQSASIPVVLLTASPEIAAGYGADGVIAKPFQPHSLVPLLCELLGWSDPDGPTPD